jgi:xylose isomerase
MTTVNLFTRPIFKEGALTANNPDVRRFALAKAMDAIDLGAELGAEIFVMWGGREGTEAHAAKPVAEALDRYLEAINTLTAYITERNYHVRIALEPKPNEPRGDILLPTVGHALAFIDRLDSPEMVGVNPELAHETMSGLSFHHGVAQAIWAGKLFHIDLNAQRIGRFDQDFRFGAEEVKEAFYLVHLLETSGYNGMRHFDAHPYRTDGPDGVWAFARGCIRTYLILKDKAARFESDPEIKEALKAAQVPDLSTPTTVGDGTPGALRAYVKGLDEAALARTDYGHEHLDQLVTELLLGVR